MSKKLPQEAISMIEVVDLMTEVADSETEVMEEVIDLVAEVADLVAEIVLMIEDEVVIGMVMIDGEDMDEEEVLRLMIKEEVIDQGPDRLLTEEEAEVLRLIVDKEKLRYFDEKCCKN